jgi:hypothetical protein
MDPRETAATLMGLMEKSETEMAMVFSGGEPNARPR